MIKFTNCLGNALYIDPAKVIAVGTNGGETAIYCTGAAGPFGVQEDPEWAVTKIEEQTPDPLA